MKTNYVTYWICLVFLLAAACKKESTPSTITELIPNSGIQQNEVHIVGKGFSGNLPGNVVKFNGMDAELMSISGDTITAWVPKGAGTGPVTISVDGKTITGPVFNYIKSPSVTMFSGSGVEGTANGDAQTAQFKLPEGLATDAQGNVYVCDTYNHRIRKINPDGVVSTLAGSTEGFANGNGVNARFRFPVSLVCDAQGNLYVADMYNHAIRKVTPQGDVTTIAGAGAGWLDGAVGIAKFNLPTGIAIDPYGLLHVADMGNNAIRRIIIGGGVSTILNQGLDSPFGIVIDRFGIVYISNKGSHGIVTLTSFGLEVVAGVNQPGHVDAQGMDARFNAPSGITVDGDGNIYVADTDNHRIRKIAPGGIVTTIAGSANGYINGPGANAQFSFPMAIAIDNAGQLYVADKKSRIRKILNE